MQKNSYKLTKRGEIMAAGAKMNCDLYRLNSPVCIPFRLNIDLKNYFRGSVSCRVPCVATAALELLW